MSTIQPDDHEDLQSIQTDQENQSERTPTDTEAGIRKLPKLQIFVLTFTRMSEPISFTVIFPMVTFMVVEFNPKLSEDQVGYYCGLIESIFSISQFLTIIFWGKLSDRIGRKPVIQIGLLGVALCTISFGFSYSLPSMIISRAIGGALNGNAAVIKSAFGELTTTENQALVFSLLPICFAIGSIIGPLLGGYLNRPADRFPDSKWFSKSLFWRNHPWLLPCIVAALAPLIGFILVAIWFKETHPVQSEKRRVIISNNNERQPLLESGDQQLDHHTIPHTHHIDHSVPLVQVSPVKQPSIGILDLLKDSNLVTILTSYSLLSFQTISLEAILILFAYTPIRSGGLGFSSEDIGLTLSLSNGISILVQIILFPFFQRRFGTAKLYKFCMAAYPFIFILFPLVNYIARIEENTNPNHPVMIGVWIGVWIISISKASANMVFSCNMLLVNSAAPSRDVLATVNGMAQSCASFVRAVGPITASSLYALSIEKYSNHFNGHLIFGAFSLFACFAFFNSLKIRDHGLPNWRDHN